LLRGAGDANERSSTELATLAGIDGDEMAEADPRRHQRADHQGVGGSALPTAAKADHDPRPPATDSAAEPLP